jgi:hypothetical protein
VTGRRRPRTVIYGPYPPIPGASATATLEHVRRLLAAGTEVRVISPTPSAAHEHADLRRPMEAWRFARQASGAAQLTIHLDAGLIASAGHRQELPARLALAVAVRSAGHSTVYLPRGHDQLSAPWVRLVVDAADEVLAEVEELPDDPGGADPPIAALDWNLGTQPTREEMEAEIRRRADLRRTAEGREPASAGGALRAIPRLHPAGPRSANPLVAGVKHVVRRLVAWQIDPVIEHVNLLHWAVTEANGETRTEAGPQDPAVDTSP